MANKLGVKRVGDKLDAKTINAAIRDAASMGPGERRRLWDGGDGGVKGLCCRVSRAGSTWLLVYRTIDKRQRALELGDFPAVTCAAARAAALTKLAAIAKGEDPAAARDAARAGLTVKQLGERYIKQAKTTKRESSWKMDERTIERFIEPRWGTRKITSIGARDAEELHASMASTPVLANRTRALVSCMFAMAERWGLHPGPNPARHVQRYPEKPVHRPLSDDDFKKLGTKLEEVRAEARHALEHRGRHSTDRPLARDLLRACDIIELLILTGCRRGEIVNLTWPEVDLDGAAIHLAEDKAGGGRTVWLCPEAVAILERQGDERAGFVFPGRTDGKPLQGLNHVWQRIRLRAELPGNPRLHDLRHSVGASAAAAGFGQAAIAAMLGHRQTRTADRYTAPHRDRAASAAVTIGSSLASALAKRDEKGAEKP